MLRFAYSSGTRNNLVHLSDPVRGSVSLNKNYWARMQKLSKGVWHMVCFIKEN